MWRSCRPVQSAERQDRPAAVDVHVPAALALGRTLPDFRASFQAHRQLVVADPAVEEAPAGQLVDDLLLLGRGVWVVPEDAISALAKLGHEVEAQFFVGKRVVAAVAAELPLVLAAVLEDDLVGEVIMHDGVLVPAGYPGRHRVLGAEEPLYRESVAFPLFFS